MVNGRADRPSHGPDQEGTPPLLERVRIAIRLRHYSRRTEKAYRGWVVRFVRWYARYLRN